MKPHISKVRGTTYWNCNGCLGLTAKGAFVRWSTVHKSKRVQSTACPHCSNTKLARLSSLNKRYCSDCGAWLTWDLKPGQAPLVGPARPVRKAQ